MGRKKTVVEENQTPIDVDEAIGLDSSVFSSVEDIESEQEGLVAPKKAKSHPIAQSEELDDDGEEPLMSSPKWSDFVMKHFENEELDNQGNPCVTGLRRVARLLLGPVLVSSSRVIQCPNPMETTSTRLLPAVAEHRLVILWTRLEGDSQSKAYEVEFSDIADVSERNTDPEFCRFATATAGTRAEARAYRKALQLQRVSSEETTLVPIEEATISGNITPTQVNFIDILCSRNDINLWVYVNLGKEKFKNIVDIPHSVAAKMIEHLSGLQNKPETISEKIKGYEANWRKSQE